MILATKEALPGMLPLGEGPPAQLPLEADSRVLAHVERASRSGPGGSEWPWVFANRKVASAPSPSPSSRISHSPSLLELDSELLAGARPATAVQDLTASTSFPPSPESRLGAQRERPGARCSARHPGASCHP